ncbi:hypothetical protein CsSME_00014266 [Camellia sinensis var. sinensis]
MEINSDVKREEVESLVRELMGGGEKGKEMKRKVMEWKNLGEEATACFVGSSYLNFDKLVRSVLMSTGSNESSCVCQFSILQAISEISFSLFGIMMCKYFNARGFGEGLVV